MISLSVCRDVRHAPIPGHTSLADGSASRLRQSVVMQPRFGRRCYFCDFSFGASEHFEIHHLDGDHSNSGADNVVPVCTLCHAPFHLDLVTRRWRSSPGKIIYLPELGQAELNNLLQAIFFAKSEQQFMVPSEPVKDPGAVVTEAPVLSANSLFVALERRAAYVEALPDGTSGRPGLATPSTLARVLTEMTDADYAQRDVLLHGLRYLPSETYLVEEARHWKEDGAAFAGLDIAAWPAVAGMA
ncbi:MAG: HNH endonuclease [Burkholderiaceae bacterium]|nr:MAG: HNH endonuclease [Burkholderiaceae bacterium]